MKQVWSLYLPLSWKRFFYHKILCFEKNILVFKKSSKKKFKNKALLEILSTINIGKTNDLTCNDQKLIIVMVIRLEPCSGKTVWKSDQIRLKMLLNSDAAYFVVAIVMGIFSPTTLHSKKFTKIWKNLTAFWVVAK